MVLTLYKADESAASRAVLMLFEMLKVEAVMVDVDLMAGEHLRQEFIKKNPLHTVPTLQDNDFTIFDSTAIAAYVVDQFAKDDALYPKDLQQRSIVNQRLMFNCGILLPALQRATHDVIILRTGKVSEECRKAISSAYEQLEKLLDSTNGPWLAGDQISIADLCSASTVSSLEFIVSIDINKFTNIVAWYTKCYEMPAFKNKNMPGNNKLRILFNSLLK